MSIFGGLEVKAANLNIASAFFKKVYHINYCTKLTSRGRNDCFLGWALNCTSWVSALMGLLCLDRLELTWPTSIL